ncbi:MAG: cation diffusion facilitator family transporter [Nitrososphaeraceae archaeon]
MDSQYAIDTSSLNTEGSLIASEKKLKNEQLPISKMAFTDKAHPKNIVNEGLIAGQKIAKISIIILLSLGIAESMIGYWGGSIVAIADGIDSFSGAMLSFVVFFGLRIVNRPPNKKFPYGYHKVESFAALMAAIGMIIIGAIIFYISYQAFIHPHEIKQPVITMVILALAGFISFHRSFQMRNLANKYNLLSLKKEAINSIKDGSASIIGFFSVVISTQFGILQMDAIGGMVIAVYIFSVSYLSLKKSSFILVDSCEDSNLPDRLKKIIMERFSDEIINVKSILVRPTGMAMHAEFHVELDGRKRFSDVDLLLMDIEKVIRSTFPNFASLTIIPHSFKNSNTQFDSITHEIKILSK